MFYEITKIESEESLWDFLVQKHNAASAVKKLA